MSDEDDDLFGSDSDDTAELIANSKSPAKAVTKKKAPPAAAKKKEAGSSDSDDDKGLFDSDSEDERPAPKKKMLLSKRERLESLANRKRSGKETSSPIPKKKTPKGEETGYDSGDSYDSATFQRTADDDAFIDTTGEDADAVNELYAAQNFDDERPDGDDEGRKKKKKKRLRGADSDDGEGAAGGGEPDNPVMAAVYRMKKKKREKKSLTEIEDEVKVFLNNMDMAAEEDETAIAERRPATKKLQMLNSVMEMMTRRDMQRLLLDFDLLTVVKRWVQPLPNGTLGNVTVRQRLLEAVSKMTGDGTGITSNDLKRSELGKTVMVLYKHRSETPAMKRQLKALVEQWSRPIFAKSGNMRDLDRVQRGGGSDGLAAVAAARAMPPRQPGSAASQSSSSPHQDLNDMIKTGKKKSDSGGSSMKRVSVPFSKGFAYSVRPAARTMTTSAKSPEKAGGGTGGNPNDIRGKLTKRMTEKGRNVGKNQRSANISIEGRSTKG